MAALVSPSDESCPDWTSLPRDILGLIASKLVDIADRVRAAAVCKHWLFILQDANKSSGGQNQLPMLLLPTDDNSETHRSLYSVAAGRILRTPLHVPYNQRCSGSSHGWLIFAGTDLSLTLFNPFSGATVDLPPPARVPSNEDLGEGGFYSHDWEIRKVVLSKDPSLAPDDYGVLALCGYGHQWLLALFQSGAKSWIYARQKGNNYKSLTYTFQDITYFKGRFFAVNCQGLVSLEPNEGRIKLRSVLRRYTQSEQSYVVGSGDVLMLIQRYYYMSFVDGDYYNDHECVFIDGDRYISDLDVDVEEEEDEVDDEEEEEDDNEVDEEEEEEWEDSEEENDDATGYFEIDEHVYEYNSGRHHLTSHFRVYQLDIVDGKMTFVQPKNLNGHAVFLGDNYACVVSASDFLGCRPDCIYYTDDWPDMAYLPIGPVDIGVYSFEDQYTRPLCVPRYSQWDLQPPIWIVPQANSIDTDRFL